MRKLLWNFLSKIYPLFLRKRYRMNIGKNVIISYKARLDKSINPSGIYIGDNTWILANSLILAHDHLRSLKLDTRIGSNCLIGVDSIIMPGITIGNHVVVGAGAIVTKNIKSNCIVAGNPAKVIKEGIKLNDKGQLINEII
ncbi:acyltransferase [Tenacibaculum maritimum]|uniref:acyltransferase n=1 Tax=Tenacibaculum maritimum TaxID=107401 RepID=UPI0012E67AD4|nr:acyltransferase [Tenacibaculum maritimum]CAA0154381.1 exopolysaccharide biosynthesis O-acetyltransferase [Tenacibaculum maritimum]